jgi:hypothetical protein
VVAPAGRTNGALPDDARLLLREDAFADDAGELVLGMLLAGGRTALDLATESGLQLRDFFREAQRAVYHAIIAAPQGGAFFLPEDILDHMEREGRLPPEERPLRRNLEDWRSRGEMWQLLPGYVNRLRRARAERQFEQALARAQRSLDRGDLEGAAARLLTDLDRLAQTSPPTSSGGLGSEVVECSGAELLAQVDAPDPPSLPLLGQEGYFTKTWSHLMAGYSRVGKTELLARNTAEWIAAGERVLWITEESPNIWRRRLRGLPGDWSRLSLRFGLGEQLDVLRTRARSGPETVVVWDTLRNLLLPQDERDNSELARLVNPIVAETRRAGKTLVMGHHETKAEGEHGKAIAGGHALMAMFDAPMEVKFAEGADPRRRVIISHARLTRPPDLLYELRPDGTMAALGSPEGATVAAVADRCVAVLEGEWLKTSEVRDRLEEPKPGEEQLRKALLLAAGQGRVERDPPPSVQDVRGKTVRWATPGTPRETSLPKPLSLMGGQVGGGGG